MVKHRYEVSGINQNEDKFTGECIATDIISAINLFRSINLSVHEITMCEQVNKNSPIGIR